ncbi:hypothetical protein RhiirA5_395414 [Rhizophagus irregularis]|uniref:Uncharacterized protein n=3 Tax=Rhizophagus irregularis TaxID=588596 RepID=U9UT43_RHIID|nr:hypothetical protein GLOIN_2v1022074 [Rhizophagus irregularis DAOM 181602=DAOM 197198]EXX76787.1 hypothetical protein RirG_029920 [Rhizophagus irregularis DAOM 197198w]PKC14792.1 hypothetical protein RhiirA5_395414 [Rhizophagus irregularis]PKC74191.1 hypothetical protein RhiirA1_437111 [Rhizophagus irregularis]PKY13733.1 hypothetical protein RhiirB3_465608 [Rhizophagus irregularis]POG74726.1 hypothetical protein GLOIN_2v1022074 [Rhizophagus irregularis DAOM 181602=DAOM 197198]|eukprot:XP_025181592.1 hypothetical protein GLOIN_2v1022074 [Rhizophagus irregularis DAOM 181602=DAOM 197198]
MLEELHIVEMENVSEKYINCMTALLWRCSKGHEWNAPLSNIKKQIHGVPIVLDDMLVILIKPSKLHLAGISLPHILITIQIYYGNVLKDIYGMQRLMLLKIEIPGVQFVGINMKIYVVKLFLNIWDHLQVFRPDFLKIPKHPKGLELDIYYPGHNFAIEVQDPQHEKYIEFFHRDPNNFIKQQARDQLKKELCEENQIALRYV